MRSLGRRLNLMSVSLVIILALAHGVIVLRALVGRPDGSEMVQGVISGKPEDAVELGQLLAQDLLSRGAGEILKQVHGVGGDA